MNTKIKKWGNSLALRIPLEIAKTLGLTEDTDVEIKADKGSLIIKPISKVTLDALLSKVTEENIHDEIDFGDPTGNER